MKKAVLNKSICDHSPMCPVKRVCPKGAVTQKVRLLFFAETPEIDQSKCTGCGKCLNVCPHGAISLKKFK